MTQRDISPECRQALLALGFGDASGKDGGFDFCAPTLAAETGMLVEGAHATDRATVFYSVPITYEDEELCGFFYAPSLLEYLLTDYGGEWSADDLLRRLGRFHDRALRLVNVGGYPMLYIEAREASRIGYAYSDTLKLVGQLDYFLPHARRRLWNRRGEEYPPKNSERNPL